MVINKIHHKSTKLIFIVYKMSLTNRGDKITLMKWVRKKIVV